MSAPRTKISYKPDGETLRAFLQSTKFVRMLRGPVGAGKSVACAIDIFARACRQTPGNDRRRRTRWAIVRNTYPELQTTTIKTWLEWFPESVFGTFRWSPPLTHHIVWQLADNTTVDAEFLFLALDKPEDIKKLLSLELTGGWINEAREVPKAIVDALTSRLKRFPPPKDGVLASEPGLVCDTNAPDEDHWWPIMSGETPPPPWMTPDEILTLVKPTDWEFFTQPGAMKAIKGADGATRGYELNPDRENAKNLDPTYYQGAIQGKDPGWIRVYLLNQLGSLSDGRPVYYNFDRLRHVAREPLPFNPGLHLWVGIDFGLTPAGVFAQRLADGRWLILSELVPGDMGAKRFADACKSHVAQNYPGVKTIKAYGDPAGDIRVQTDEQTPFMIMRLNRFNVLPAHTNDVALRIDAVDASLTRLVNKYSGLLIDPSCTTIIRGFEAGYHYRRLKVSGEQKHEMTPNKNRYSHPHDALQYMMLGAGEGRALTIGNEPRKPSVAKVGFNPFDRQTLQRRKSFARLDRDPFAR